MKKLLSLALLLIFTSCQSDVETINSELVFEGASEYDSTLGYTVNPRFPKFSWDTVPICGHFSKGYDENNGGYDFTQEELEFIADYFPFIVLEKDQGDTSNTGAGAEYSTLAEAQKLKAINPDIKVMIYWNTQTDYTDMWATYNPSDEYPNGAALGYSTHPWVLWNTEGTEYFSAQTNSRFNYDQRVTDMQNWWISEAVKWGGHDDLDGFFADTMLAYLETTNISMAKNFDGPTGENYLALCNGVYTMLEGARAGIGDDKLMIGNCLRYSRTSKDAANGDKYLGGMDYVDIGMFEHFAATTLGQTSDKIAGDIEMIRAVAARGQATMVKGWPRYDFTDSEPYLMTDEESEAMLREDIVFPLACFLMGAGEYSYFCYGWGYRSEQGWLIDYDEFKKPLGKPLGDRVITNKYEYTRSFEHATVWANLETYEALITWKEDGND